FVASNSSNIAFEKSGMQKRAEKVRNEAPTPLVEPGMEMKESDGTEVLPGLGGEEASEEPAQQESAESDQNTEPEQKAAEPEQKTAE
ncbi:MAG: hypothetical protein ACOC36_02240, partial [Fibrobacterota bacterium]